MTQNTKPDAPKKSGEIENELGQTRNALQQDIKALGDKFTPGHIKDEAKSALAGAKDAAVDKLAETKDKAVEKLSEAKDMTVEKLAEAKDSAVEKLTEVKDATVATVSEAVDDVSYQARRIGGATWEFTRANAVPLALVGLGAGWLIANNRASGGWRPRKPGMRARRAGYALRDADYEGEDSSLLGDERQQPREARLPGQSRRPQRELARRTQSATPRVGFELSDAGNKIGESAERMYEQAGQTVTAARQKLAGSVARGRDALKSSLRRAGTATLDYADDNPIALGVVTVAAGVGLGLLLPATQRENRLLGASRDRLFGEARETARGLGDVARETMKETSNTLR
jgi:ElaB/YqjD/DUF883 family membrane-anchored ribosome-binding protein